MRKPAERTTASIVSTSATRSCSSLSASSPNGRLQRLTRKPGPSVASMTRLPIARPVARATSSASGEESMPAMTSSRRMTGGGLKKCIPTTRPGSATAPAIAVIGIDEVFDASTALRRDLAERREQLALELQALGRRLDDQPGLRQLAQLRRARDGTRLALQAALRPPPLQPVVDPRQAAFERLGHGVVQQRARARGGRELRDAGAHRPGADHADDVGCVGHEAGG